MWSWNSVMRLVACLLSSALVASGLCFWALDGHAAQDKRKFDSTKPFDELTHAEKTAAKRLARETKLHQLTVCADPGNMPLSSIEGDGYQNKIIETLGEAMDTRIVYFWRPYLERGLTRETFARDECDILLDMPADYEGLLTTNPIYRSTYVFASRKDRGIDIKSLDDPILKELKIGVFQHSGLRLALARHGLRDNVSIHVISHDADLSPEKQPWRQVQEVVDGKIDVAGVWGPFAGYPVAKLGAPLKLQPANLMDDETPLEFDLAIGMRTTDAVLKFRLDDALEASKDRIKDILTEYGVPLVQCSKCVVTGDIPSHGSYFTHQQERARQIFLEGLSAERTELNKAQATADQVVTQERVDEWLKDGSDLTTELSNAVLASDKARVEALLAKGADINRRNKQGLAPLHGAARQRDSEMIALLLAKGADVNAPDSDGWTPLLHAAFRNHVPSIDVLVKAGADLETGTPQGYTPLALALEEEKYFAAKALLDLGAEPDTPLGTDALTPLMVIASKPQFEKRAQTINQGPSSVEIAKLLIAKGSNVNSKSKLGVTPLMVSAAYNNAPIAGLLIQAGADIDAKTPSGQTALDIAKANQNAAAIQQLEVMRGAKTTQSPGEAPDAKAIEPAAGQ